EDDAFPSVPPLAAFVDDNGNHLLAWWLRGNAQGNPLEAAPAHSMVKDLEFQDPVLVDLLTGDISDARQYLSTQSEGSQCKGVHLTDYPLIIAERNTIDYNN